MLLGTMLSILDPDICTLRTEEEVYTCLHPRLTQDISLCGQEETVRGSASPRSELSLSEWCVPMKTHLSVEQCGVPESEREEPDQIGLSCRWLCTQVWELSFLSGKMGLGCLSRAWCMPGSNMGTWAQGRFTAREPYLPWVTYGPGMVCVCMRTCLPAYTWEGPAD